MILITTEKGNNDGSDSFREVHEEAISNSRNRTFCDKSTVTIIMFENVFRQISPSFKQMFNDQ